MTSVATDGVAGVPSAVTAGVSPRMASVKSLAGFAYSFFGSSVTIAQMVMAASSNYKMEMISSLIMVVLSDRKSKKMVPVSVTQSMDGKRSSYSQKICGISHFSLNYRRKWSKIPFRMRKYAIMYGNRNKIIIKPYEAKMEARKS